MALADWEARAVWVEAVPRGLLGHRAEVRAALGAQGAWAVERRLVDFLRAQMVPAVPVEPVVLRV